MCLEEFLPGRLPLAVRDWFDPMLPEDVTDRGVGDLVPKVGQGALDAVKAAPISPRTFRPSTLP